MNYTLTKVSKNKKTGPIPVSTSSKAGCPDSCPLKEKGCYAKGGPVSIHWRKVTSGERGGDLEEFCQSIRKLPKGTLWRHNQAGDLAHEQGELDAPALRQLVKANKHRKGFTYTHHSLTPHNLLLLHEANRDGLTINISCMGAKEAAQVKKTYPKLPVVTVLPRNAPKETQEDGVRTITCPAYWSEQNCQTCRLCQKADREYVIGFPAHGPGAKFVEDLVYLKESAE